MTLNLIVTNTDLKDLRKLEDQERIPSLTSDNIFRGIIYTMLSVQEKYTRQIIMYKKLLTQQLDTPEAILARPDEVSKIATGRKKTKYLIELAEWWPTSNVYDEITQDIEAGRVNEFSIRNKIARQASGLSYKGSSLLMNMCEYKEIVAVDVWTLRALVEEDYPVKSYYYDYENSKDKNTKKKHKHTYLGRDSSGKEIYFDRGISSKKEYTAYENFFKELTAKHNERMNYDFTSFDFRRLLWLKRSAWGKAFGNDTDQLEFPFEDNINNY